MRLALYHNLPSGGALRALEEYATRLALRHHIELYRTDYEGIGDGDDGEVGDGNERLDRTVDAVHTYAPSGAGARRAWRTSVDVLRPLAPLIATQRRIAADIDRGGYDAAFLHPCRVTQTPALLWMLRTPTAYYMQEPRRISYEHGLKPHVELTGPLSAARKARRTVVERQIRLVDERAAQAADLILANSHYSIESIYRAYGRDAVFCPLGADGDLFRIPAGGRRENRILSVGALVPHKGHDLVVRSAAAVPRSRRPRVTVVFNRGLPECRTGLERLAAECQVQLELHHAVPDERLAELYGTSVATFCGARLEPFGLTVLESLCCGTPVIAVREAGLREAVIDGQNGILIDRDPCQGGAAIETLLDGDLGDPVALRKTVVSAWSWDRAATVLESRLTTLLAEPAGRHPPVIGRGVRDRPSKHG